MFRFCCARIFVSIVLGGLAIGTASASDVSFTGSFAGDDALQYFQFVAASPAALIQTWGYGGTGAGTNAAGNTIGAGGFDPVISLFDTTGGLMNPANSLIEYESGNAACGPGSQQTDPGTGACLDAIISRSDLTAGDTYLLVLSQYDNEPLGVTFGDGFSEAGTGNFTGAYGCANGQFCDFLASDRTANWAVDITGVTSASQLGVPEPGTALLVSTALGAAMVLRRRWTRRAR